MGSLRLHRNALVFDAHCDFLSHTVRDGRRFAERLSLGHVDLPRLVEGGVTAQVFALFPLGTQQRPIADDPTVEVLRQVDAFHHLQDVCGGRFVAAMRATEIFQAEADGRVAGVLGLEGVEALAGELGLLRVFHQLGVRIVGLTWNHRNAAADGVGVVDAGGLTDFGRRVVREACRLGMVLDVSHLAPPGFWEVLELVEGPVISSHANAAALCPHPRNLSDAQLDGLAASGGVACVTYVPGFITVPPEQPSLERLLDHIDYLARRIGTDHIGLGSDFDGYDGVTAGLEDTACLPALTAGLVARAYPESAIRGILGLNQLRVFRQVAG